MSCFDELNENLGLSKQNFLATLTKASLEFGNSGDIVAVLQFVDWCHDECGIERPKFELSDV